MRCVLAFPSRVLPWPRPFPILYDMREISFPALSREADGDRGRVGTRGRCSVAGDGWCCSSVPREGQGAEPCNLNQAAV